MFGDLAGYPAGYVNTNELAREWKRRQPVGSLQGGELYERPHVCEGIIQAAHAGLGLAWSYGGWGENRSDIWSGSYLERGAAFIHRGVDFNVPAGTLVESDNWMDVLYVGNDHPLQGGWGTYVLAQLRHKPVALLYGHLDQDCMCREGQLIGPGQAFAKVGTSSNNGQWYPHLHLQALTSEAIELFFADIHGFDGYGRVADVSVDLRLFPDPLPYVRLE